MTALFLCVGMVKAAVTDVPEMSTDGDIKWYTIKNVRKQKYATYAGEASSMTQQATVQDGSLFYFTGTVADGVATVKIHNALAGELLCAGTNSWTAEGIDWYIAAKTTTGLAISKTADFSGTESWNDFQGGGQKVDYWTATDDGSIWEIELFGSDIQKSIDKLLACKENPQFGEPKYNEEAYNALVAAYDVFKANATMANYNACAEIIAGLEVYMPEEGKFYVIECPIFFAKQGVSKGLNGTPGWNTIDLTDANYYWTVEVQDGTYALKNLGTGTYLNGGEMSATAAYAQLNYLGQQQFNIVVNGTTVHANNHGSGANASGNIVSWGGSANSASAWVFIEKNDPTTLQEAVVNYNFTYEGEVKYTQTASTLVGEEWPAITVALPYTVSATKPEGVIAAEDLTDGAVTKEIALTVGELPFVAAANAESIEAWYYVQMHSNNKKYIQYLADQTYIEWADAEMDETAKDTYTWAFVGSIFDGFKLVNKAATVEKALQSTGSGDATMVAYAEGTQFVLAATSETSEGAQGGFCLRYPENNQYLNAQNGKVAHWASTDAGSTFTVTLVENEPAVDPNDFTSAIVNADLSTGDAWNTGGTKGISGGMVKVASESAFDFSQTITLPAGQYKMTAKAVYRYTGSEAEEFAAIEAGTKTRLVNLYAETATYKYEADVMNRYDGASDTDYAAGNGSVPVNGKFVPNSSSAVQAWFDNGQYVNELVFNVQEEGQVKIGLTRTGGISGDYTNIGAWTLTRLGDAEADPEVEEPTPDPDPTPDPEEPGETTDVDMTDKVNKNGWICENGKPNGVTIDGIAMQENFQDGQTSTSASTTGVVLWQDVTGLENGNYTVELWANARVAWQDSPATDGQEELTYLVANNVEISMKVFLNPGLNNNATYVLEGVEVTDGTLHIEMNKKAAGSNWHSIQIKSLTLHVSNNEALNLAKADLQAALESAAAVSPATDALTAAIAAAQAVYDNSNDKDEVVAATAALKTATVLANNTNAVAGASEENPVLTTFVVNGTFDAGKDPWKSTTGAQNQGTASNQQGAFTGNFFENWNGSNYTGKLYQVIENIPNGVYELSICAFVETFDGSAQFVYANADKVALTTGAPTAYTVRTIVDNNTIEVGFEQTVAVNRWSGIDNVSLTYLGEASNEAVLNAAKEAFTAAYDEFGAALAACQAMMLKMSFYEIDDAAYQLNEQLETTTDVDALNAMAETLAEATASLKEINEVYADYDVFVQKFKAAAEISEPKTTEAAELLEFNMYGGAGMQATSLEVLAQAVETIKADYFTYIANANLLDGNMFDLTYLIQNPDFTMNLDGWTGVKANRIGGEGYDGVGGIAEIGEWGASSWNASMSQAITGLPNGKYVVKAAWMSATGIQMTFAANAGETTVTGIGDQGGNIAKDGSVVEMGQGHRGWQYVEVEGLVEDGTLTILVSSSSETQYQWSNADAFELYYAGVPEVVEPEYLAIVSAVVGEVALVEGTATVQSISTIDVTFDCPVALAENAGWATLEDKWGPTNLDAEVLAENACVVRFTVSAEFNGEFTDAGEYYLNIPEGFIVGAEDANYINAAIEAVITIEAAPATPLTVVNVTVGEDVMADFSAIVATPEAMIKVNFDGKFYFQSVPVIVDAEGNDASDAFEFMNGLDYDGTNSYIFMSSKAGIYTITLAKESFMEYEMMGWKAPAEDIVLTVQILDKGQGIDNIAVDADAVIYDIHGRRVEKMEKGIYIVNGKKVIKK